MAETHKDHKDNKDKENNKDFNKDIAALKDDISSLTKKVGDLTEEKFSKMKEKGKEMASNMEGTAYKIGAKARETFEEAEGKIKEGSDYIAYQTKSHPLIAIGVSFLVGMLVEKLFSSNR